MRPNKVSNDEGWNNITKAEQHLIEQLYDEDKALMVLLQNK